VGFMSHDPYPGWLGRPSTQHGYSYVSNNPVNKTDPSGLCEEVGDEACWSLAERLWIAGAGSINGLGSMTESQLAGIKIASGTTNVYWPLSEIESIKGLLPAIRRSTQLHNPSNSNLDDASFAALMITILHFEGRLPGNAKPNTFGNWLSDEGSDFATFVGVWNGTTGIANVRPSVAFELHQEGYSIEGSGYSADGLICRTSPRNPRINPLQLLGIELQISTISIEYLAANLERGINRVRAEGLEPSAFNLAAWHNSGVYTPLGFANRDPKIGLKSRSYGNTIIGTMPEAFIFLGEGGIYRAYNANEQLFVDEKNR